MSTLSKSSIFSLNSTVATAGFSLIELTIAIAVMMLILGVGVASFITFNDRQQVIGAARELKGLMRSAQSRARLGDRPSTCDKLQRYDVRVSAGASTVQQIAICDNGEVVRQTSDLTGSVTAESPINIGFKVLHGGVVNPGVVTLGSQAGLTYTFSVTQGGEITEGELTTPQ